MLFWLKALSCSTVASCSHYKHDLAERLAGIQGLLFSVPPLLAHWTFLQNRSGDQLIHSLLPQGTSSLRGYGTPGSGSHPTPLKVGRVCKSWVNTGDSLLLEGTPPLIVGRVYSS